MTASMPNARKAEPAHMQACQLCAKPFGKLTKLQRHLLQAHPVDVTIARDGRTTAPGGAALNEEQRRADDGVRAALAAANLAMQLSNTGSGVDCPQCLPDTRGKIFKNAIDLASHMIIKHNIIPSDDDSDDDEDTGQQSVADLFPGAARHHFAADDEVAPGRIAATRNALAVSEISEKLASRKRALPDTQPSGSDAAKRTKLLCVDVSNDGAKAPIPREVPNPISSVMAKPELKVCSTSLGSPDDSGAIDQGAHEASAAERSWLASATPAGSSHRNCIVKEEPNTAGVFRDNTAPARVEATPREIPKNTTATSKKPPVTPKTAENNRESILSAVDAVAREILASRQEDARSGKGKPPSTAQTEALPGLIPVSGNPLVSRAKFMTVGFDMDFTDICDFPSSVHRAYYRQAGTVENGSAKP